MLCRSRITAEPEGHWTPEPKPPLPTPSCPAPGPLSCPGQAPVHRATGKTQGLVLKVGVALPSGGKYDSPSSHPFRPQSG